MSTEFVDIVFDKLPGHDGCKFIEVEDDKGRSINFGEWVKRPDGLAALRLYKGYETTARFVLPTIKPVRLS